MNVMLLLSFYGDVVESWASATQFK